MSSHPNRAKQVLEVKCRFEAEVVVEGQTPYSRPEPKGKAGLITSATCKYRIRLAKNTIKYNGFLHQKKMSNFTE